MVFGKELASKLAAGLVESGGKHHVAMVRVLIGVCSGQYITKQLEYGRTLTTAGHDTGEIILPVRQEKLVGFVNNSVPC